MRDCIDSRGGQLFEWLADPPPLAAMKLYGSEDSRAWQAVVSHYAEFWTIAKGLQMPRVERLADIHLARIFARAGWIDQAIEGYQALIGEAEKDRDRVMRKFLEREMEEMLNRLSKSEL